MSAETMTIGLSSCPNDTYIFHALLHGLVPAPTPAPPAFHMADVEELNGLARRGTLPVTKISLGVIPYIMDSYAILSSGAALGWGCGPLVVAREQLPESDWKTARTAVPGLLTTANLLLDLHGGFQGPRQDMLFSDVMDAVISGRADIGVIIHEGRFTYGEHGLVKLLDLGQWWESVYNAPLPLGAIAVRRDVPRDTARAMQEAIRQSLDYADAHPEASRDYIRRCAQELSDEVTRAHIRTFVTEFSRDLGAAGREAIQRLVERAAARLGKALPADGLFLN
ncbi:1,4-dihydroxy-6-naphthoate synthase [Desulfovibrio sp.]|uniref:1,4-dihydroxy-6-naphthoate synthase n=1 Tax=Desulfovibrio sp. TaxID=885 RepID=UPI0025C5CD13|nr:1,4-dihydroxy-6-naphthoate synthase [Desulfovibrio sp.]MCI7568937.1 1,4-dihydroxy-6-naphthoate synthase [Desulfovibrio sp.]